MKKIVALVLSLVMVLGLATTAMAAPDTTVFDDVYWKSTNNTDLTADPAGPVDLTLTAAEEVVYNTDGTLKTEGNIAYYTIEGSVKTYVVVSTLAEADMVIYKDADGDNVYMYLDEVKQVTYVGAGAAYADFGKECGQIAKTNAFYNKDATYYVANKVLYRVAKVTEDGDRGVMVDGKVVDVVTCNTLAALVTPHTAICTYKDGVITAVECKECELAAVKAPNFASIPVGAQNVYDNVAGAYWYFPAAATQAPAAGDKVESAETFDAGIAMYVGMSVMAAAGSAVVLKKKD